MSSEDLPANLGEAPENNNLDSLDRIEPTWTAEIDERTLSEMIPEGGFPPNTGFENINTFGYGYGNSNGNDFHWYPGYGHQMWSNGYWSNYSCYFDASMGAHQMLTSEAQSQDPMDPMSSAEEQQQSLATQQPPRVEPPKHYVRHAHTWVPPTQDEELWHLMSLLLTLRWRNRGLQQIERCLERYEEYSGAHYFADALAQMDQDFEDEFAEAMRSSIDEEMDEMDEMIHFSSRGENADQVVPDYDLPYGGVFTPNNNHGNSVSMGSFMYMENPGNSIPIGSAFSFMPMGNPGSFIPMDGQPPYPTYSPLQPQQTQEPFFNFPASMAPDQLTFFPPTFYPQLVQGDQEVPAQDEEEGAAEQMADEIYSDVREQNQVVPRVPKIAIMLNELDKKNGEQNIDRTFKKLYNALCVLPKAKDTRDATDFLQEFDNVFEDTFRILLRSETSDAQGSGDQTGQSTSTALLEENHDDNATDGDEMNGESESRNA